MEAGYLNLYGHDETKARDLKVARDVAEQTARSKSEFLANMSHEIRTPMNGIVGMSDMLAQTDLTAHQRTLAEIIQSSSQSLLTILNDILDFSKLEAGQFSLVSEPFAIRSVVEGVATLLSTQSSEKDVEMLVRIASGVPEQLVGDAGRVRQLLMNIVGNAAGRLALAAGHQRGRLRGRHPARGAGAHLRQVLPSGCVAHAQP